MMWFVHIHYIPLSSIILNSYSSSRIEMQQFDLVYVLVINPPQGADESRGYHFDETRNAFQKNAVDKTHLIEFNPTNQHDQSYSVAI